jgi:hypothetical protein
MLPDPAARWFVVGMLAWALSGCAPKQVAPPEIVVAPGLRERLAFMDRFRLHDEGRQRMMASETEASDEAEEDDADRAASARGDAPAPARGEPAGASRSGKSD